MTNMRPNRTNPTRRVVLLAYDECQASAVVSMIEVLNIANEYVARGELGAPAVFRWQVVSPDGRPPHAMGNVTLAVESRLAKAEDPDVVFVPGAHFTGNTQRLEQQVATLAESCGAWLAEQQRKGAVLAASCSGVLVLAKSGLLAGKRATTSWFLGKLLRSSYPHVRFCEGELVTRDGRVFSSGAFTASLELMLQVVEHFAGPAVALACAKVMLIDANRDSQFPYMTLQARQHHNDHLVLQAQSRIRSQVREDISVENIAQRLGVSPRTLNRRFHAALGRSPAQYLQEVRVEGAKRLLETSRLSLEEIIERVGYRDSSSFRRTFERMTKVSPSRYRQMFSMRGK